MDVGTIFSQADSGTDAAAIRDWAVAADDAGFHHLLAYDHILGAPVERIGIDACAPFPAPPYTDASTFHEILALFAHLAAITDHIEFASSVLVLPQRQTALVAKQIATVDRRSPELVQRPTRCPDPGQPVSDTTPPPSILDPVWLTT